ncbi:NAD(P)H-quinone oxidoreductase [Cellulomonas composti]|uniref:NAD(P)H quinone oxidoreductase n=1 Tax=Cellulomonas composti TaxID=266130 RepID=A0A511JBQ5_9CELL|nr:NAD(P)H-quinone oxidoreductase [Cellulomonas composti]GEL95420.1 NAD(P)H quinone oxidoreductase [Cellulomonas composti]
MRAVVITGPGGPDVLTVAIMPDPEPGPGELVLDVRAAGVNRADLLQRAGHYPPPPGAPEWPGLEVAGVVRAVGAGVHGWAPGMRAAALLAGGGYAEQVVVPADLALVVPDDVADDEAAALPEALATAWSNLDEAGARAGESILVRGGSGGIGTVAVQLAAALGLRVLATAGGPSRVARVASLGAEVFDHREDGLADRVLAATDGRGVDVILDVLGAGGLEDNVRMLATGGRLMVIGLQQGRRGTLDLGALMARRGRVVTTTLRSREPDDKARIVAGVRAHAWPLVAAHRVRGLVHARLPLSEAGEAHRLLDSGDVFGKLVLIP